jgi:hypothetical protein
VPSYTREEDQKGIFWLLGIGALAGWMLGYAHGDGRISDALDWAVEQTFECEKVYEEEHFTSVADCLRDAITQAEEESREP